MWVIFILISISKINVNNIRNCKKNLHEFDEVVLLTFGTLTLLAPLGPSLLAGFFEVSDVARVELKLGKSSKSSSKAEGAATTGRLGSAFLDSRKGE